MNFDQAMTVLFSNTCIDYRAIRLCFQTLDTSSSFFDANPTMDRIKGYS
jgi:hypothetical protein